MLSDNDLVDRARRGDLQAFEQLIRKYQDQVFRFALYALPTRQDAEDVAQETFIAAFRYIGRFRGDASFLTWLMSIARKKAASLYRSRRATEVVELVEELSDGSGIPLEHLEIRAAVSALPKPYRDLVVLRYVNQLDVKEIAAATGISTSAAASRLFDARRMLREALGNDPRQEVCRDEV